MPYGLSVKRGYTWRGTVRLLNTAGQGASNAAECPADGIRQGVHAGNGAQADQSRNQRVFDQVLTGIFFHQADKNFFHVCHCVLLVLLADSFCQTARHPGGSPHGEKEGRLASVLRDESYSVFVNFVTEFTVTVRYEGNESEELPEFTVKEVIGEIREYCNQK